MRIFGRLPHTGHAGVREWWGVMVASGRWYDVVVDEVRVLGPDRCTVLGEIHDRGEVSVRGEWRGGSATV